MAEIAETELLREASRIWIFNLAGQVQIRPLALCPESGEHFLITMSTLVTSIRHQYLAGATADMNGPLQHLIVPRIDSFYQVQASAPVRLAKVSTTGSRFVA